DEADVSRIVAQTPEGSYGLLPHRLDCVAALAPGILIYENAGGHEVCLAVDEGVMVETGAQVLVSVRRATPGKDLGQLLDAVTQQFLAQDAQDRSLRSVLDQLESGFRHRFAGFQYE
ncbi:MAG: F0F1 ATP synthase subunit epsilon, partial [Polaromonas sp.]|uniref:F0F1 ATP synthase subunit epsilon n=1 Tax=Polaromonas sp. TaxID=1869339 RepID=UPI001852C0D6